MSCFGTCIGYMATGLEQEFCSPLAKDGLWYNNLPHRVTFWSATAQNFGRGKGSVSTNMLLVSITYRSLF